jgi:putative ABC transport system ATP-binding protein
LAQLTAAEGQNPRGEGRYSVSLRHVRKSYGGTEVYSDLHFNLLRGTFVALVGPIGSGKTTLVNMLAGIERPTSGSVTVMGEDITKMSEDALGAFRGRTIGLVPQAQTLVPELTVRENVELPLCFLDEGGDARRRKAEEAMARVGIAGESGRVAGTLSVGERQMVSIARALVNDPPILLLDEPTEALDPLMSEVVLGLLRGDNMTKGRTVFVTTHDRRVTALARTTLRAAKRIA